MNIFLSGIAGNVGKPTAHHLRVAGHRVAASVRMHKPTDVEAELVLTGDLVSEAGSAEMVAEAVRHFGQLHCGVLLAGGYAGGQLKSTDWSAMEAMLHLNFRTAWNVARPLFNHMMQQGQGRIIFIGARPGLVSSAATGAVAYSLSKSLLFKLSDIINASGRDHQVDSVVIVPHVIDTPQNRASMPDADFSKWIKPDVIAERIVNLCSDLSPLKEPVIEL